jgi:hypothetical protein
MRRRVVGSLGALFVVFVASAEAPAQCVTGWQPGVSPPAGATSMVSASTLWDPDGPGPQPAALVVVGGFSFVGSAVVNAVAVLDPATGSWSGLGGGVNGAVSAVIAMPNGDLVIGGQFTAAGGQPAVEVARWNGSTWSAMSNLPVSFGEVRAFALLPNGELVAAGGFGAARFATWNGVTWTSLGPTMLGQVEALLVRPGGMLVAAGQFNVPAGPTLHVAEWNGSAWMPVGGDVPTYVRTLATAANGDLLAGGVGLRRFNGTTWSVVGDATQSVYALAVTGGGDIVVGGNFGTFAGIPCGSIVQSAGTGWSSLAGGFSTSQRLVRCLTVLPNGALAVGGGFVSAGGVPCLNLAQWNGSAWSKLTPKAFDSTVRAGVALPNGDVVVGGQFTGSPGGPAAGIARWDGASWSPLGSGLASAGNPGTVLALAGAANGDVVAGGIFTTAGGLPALNIARWNGTAWSPLAFGLNGQVKALAIGANGDLHAGGDFADIARWNGSNWLTSFGCDGPVQALSAAPNGDVVAGGWFNVIGTTMTGSVARWDGSTWSAVGSGSSIGLVNALAWMPNGDLVAGGHFGAQGPVPTHVTKRWNGSTWSPILGLQGTLRALVALPNGDLIAGGLLSLSSGTPSKAFRWNGSVWSPIGPLDGEVFMLVADAAGVPWAGGSFQNLGQQGAASAYLTRMATNCPATSAPFGSGCPSPGGNNTLVATRPPWVNGTFVATATGLPQDCAIVAVTSFTSLLPGFPLGSVFPGAAPGCNLHVFPDILGTLVTSTGAVQSSLFLPNVPPLVGLTFYHQLVPFDVLGAITTTNALQLTAGSL